MKKQTLKRFWTALRITCMASLFAASSFLSTQAQTRIVNYSGIVIGGNVDLQGKPTTGTTGDWDSDGLSDDKRSVRNFSESTAMNPNWNQASTISSVFYGGAEALYFNTTTVVGFNRFQIRNAGSPVGQIQILTQANTAGQALHVIVVWLLPDFKNVDPLTQRVELGAGSAMTLGIVTEGTVPVPNATHRFVVKQGGQYYVSSATYATSGTQTLDPSTTTWAPYNPVTNLNFDQAAATFSSMVFTDVEAVGYYCENDSTTTQISSRILPFTVDATLSPSANVAPANTVPGNQSVYEDTALPISGIGVNDADGNLWKTKLTAAHGKLNVTLTGGARIDGGANNSATLTLMGSQIQINAALATLSYAGNANYAGADTITVVSTDFHGAAATSTVNINVLPVNDAPAGTDRTNFISQFTAYAFTETDFGFTDPVDNPANLLSHVKITTLPALGTLALNNVPVSAGDSIAVTDIPALTYTAPGFGTNYSAFTFQVQDDGGTANGGIDLDPTPNTLTFAVAQTPVNHEPAGGDRVVTTTVDTPYTFTALDFGFSDPLDTPPHNFLAVRIAQLPAAGSLTLFGYPVAAGDTIAVANFPGFVFTPSPGQLGSPYTTFQFQVQDDGGTLNGGVDLDQTPNTLTVNVIAANTPPVNNVPSTLSVDEDVTLNVPISVADTENNLVTTALTAGSGTLNVDLAAGAVITAGANGSAALTLGGSQAQVNAALATLTYLGNTNFFGSDSLVVSSTDSGALNDTDTIAITVRPVNDPPLIAGAPPQTTLEDVPVGLYGISVSDADDDLATTSLSVSHGKLTIGLVAGGATISAGANETAGFTLAGTVAQVNEVIGTLVYTPSANFNGADPLTIIAADATGLKATNSVSIDVTPLADSFTWDSDSTTPGIQDGAGVWTTNQAHLNWSDSAANNVFWPVSTGDDSAYFGAVSGTAGLITVEDVHVAKMIFIKPSAGSYSFTNGIINFGNLNPEIAVDTDDSVTIASVVAGTNGFAKTGAGSLVLSGTNSISGRIGLNGGTLRADVGIGIPTGAAVVLANGVWEISQDVTATWGTGPGQVSWSLNQGGAIAGFSALGSAPLSVQVGTTGRDVPGGKNGNQLLLNSTNATQALSFQTPLSFSSRGYVRVDSTSHPVTLTKKWTVGGTGVRQGKVGLGTLILQGGFENAGGGGTDPNVYQGRLVVDNCNVVWTGDGSAFNIGRGDFGVGKAILELKGTANLTTKPGFGISLGLSNDSDLELNGGTAIVSRIIKATTNGVSTVYFDGGSVVALDANNAAAFITGLDNVFIKSGGAILDDGGFSGITIANSLKTDLTSLGGGLTKRGTGSLVLTNESTYTGPTLVKAGTLVCTIPTALAGGNLDISAGAKLQLDFPGTRQVAQLTIAGGAPLPDGTYGSSVSPAANKDDLHFAGTGTVTVGTLAPPTPNLPLAGFTVTSGVPSFTFPTVSGYKYRIVFANELPAAVWNPVIDTPGYPAPDGWSPVSTGESMTITDPSAMGQPQRFYRLETALP